MRYKEEVVKDLTRYFGLADSLNLCFPISGYLPLLFVMLIVEILFESTAKDPVLNTLSSHLNSKNGG